MLSGTGVTCEGELLVFFFFFFEKLYVRNEDQQMLFNFHWDVLGFPLMFQNWYCWFKMAELIWTGTSWVRIVVFFTSSLCHAEYFQINYRKVTDSWRGSWGTEVYCLFKWNYLSYSNIQKLIQVNIDLTTWYSWCDLVCSSQVVIQKRNGLVTSVFSRTGNLTAQKYHLNGKRMVFIICRDVRWVNSLLLCLFKHGFFKIFPFYPGVPDISWYLHCMSN